MSGDATATINHRDSAVPQHKLTLNMGVNSRKECDDCGDSTDHIHVFMEYDSRKAEVVGIHLCDDCVDKHKLVSQL